ncbi:protein of unknown function [Serratia sp. Tan611]|nr:protein of unknown function [Serratia sp. Tan611]
MQGPWARPLHPRPRLGTFCPLRGYPHGVTVAGRVGSTGIPACAASTGHPCPVAPGSGSLFGSP